MSRVKISLPEKFIFQIRLQVRIYDLNYGAHTGNDTILRFMHEARMNFLRSLGINDEIRIAGNTGIIVADSSIEYKAETFFGDRIQIFLAVDGYHKYGFNIFYHLVHDETKREVARGKTGIIFFNYSLRKIAAAPEDFIAGIKALSAIK